MRSSIHFEKLAFVSDAIGKDNTRPYYTDAYYDAEKKRISATDGRRLHVWNLSEDEVSAFGLSESSYVKIMPKDGIVLPIKKEYQFPMIDKVIPEASPKHYFSPSAKDDGSAVIALCVKTGAMFNPEYFRKMLGYGWKVSYKDNMHAFRFDHASWDVISVIMPKSFKEVINQAFPEDLNK